ncbi:uncharacterized protein OCT59_026023 [Rhizophagus irregularis]|uniref:Uncharacterized protein n=4 Tax=Rhizophagus irregularis TaxID=588596 RepID=A0A2I1EHM2_9GLOM|nr:hypothetical protein RirG_014680 [Rhizophagus irregularis DAOM 197198w]PKY21626.1 hypothetical protein RhiirB3_470438 [Rhizophagus irregularis]UZO05679.1 hypothetical protein OCT59_026023 [Rhizophagus irregularis]CAB5349908.1 unnamed protein product [Rhizophagus irregularis]CAG8602339.1 9283_t:CDS:1 [Rhizophagus irregularis]
MSIQVTRVGNQNEFNITLPPVITFTRDLENENCKEFNAIIVGLIEIKGQAFKIPSSIEITSATVLGTGTDLGYINHGDQEQEISFNVNVPNVGTINNSRVRLYMQSGTIIRLQYDIQIGNNIINGDEVIFNF